MDVNIERQTQQNWSLADVVVGNGMRHGGSSAALISSAA